MPSRKQLGDVLVLGLGATGRDVVRYLTGPAAARVGSVTVYGGAQSRAGVATCELESAGVRCVLGTDDIEGRFDLAVVSPGIPRRSAFFAAALAHADEVIGEPELAWRESPARWVAVTGTNGKTTTTTLAQLMLDEGLAGALAVGNIGTPVIERVADRGADTWFVAELSSFQLETTRLFHPRVACLLNVTPDHLEWHGSMEAYAAAKEKIFANLGGGDLAVVSADDPWCRAARDRLMARGVRTLTLDARADPGSPLAAFVRDGRLVVRLEALETELLRVDEMGIKGVHNVEDALAASCVALELGVDAAVINGVLRSFCSLRHRIEPCGTVAGVRFVNDSKATNPDAVAKALTAFDEGRVVLLLGGHDKGLDLGPLSRAVVARCKAAVCFGVAGERMARALEGARDARGRHGGLEVVRASHLRDAFRAAVSRSTEGDVVLLSPACSSFDEFQNMEERGDAFRDLVRSLAAGRGL
ncbi:UDP-N-acetylmuramoyl-L-alanine--D-glutamate ligase [Olsenella sp. HMSC062G07]|uniref:UDP-N-acetylmuramoyl-L-alanine--D-glutamate ligase n=1 Tax=Olsenella sp. HMSC062G07 TaxID=1739330 RepID=UPI0008A6466B|nr:UDP-N-acetylmuramoyl-L-alanine--D-glutamate ligase [Olsenella sp. HMSC062G07]OFK24871.1 UDP-N-acetylmuramoylalanine--D-glutamate ligase [Olsenella sp. HMSC062G07]